MSSEEELRQAVKALTARITVLEKHLGLNRRTHTETLTEQEFFQRFRVDGMMLHERAQNAKRHPDDQAIAEAKANSPELANARFVGQTVEIEVFDV